MAPPANLITTLPRYLLWTLKVASTQHWPCLCSQLIKSRVPINVAVTNTQLEATPLHHHHPQSKQHQTVHPTLIVQIQRYNLFYVRLQHCTLKTVTQIGYIKRRRRLFRFTAGGRCETCLWRQRIYLVQICKGNTILYFPSYLIRSVGLCVLLQRTESQLYWRVCE